MSDDSNQQSSQSWLDKLSYLLLREPKDQQQLVDVLRDAEQRHLLDSDSLGMIEGVLNVSSMQISDTMIPRSQMVVIQESDNIHDILPVIIESAHSRFPVVNENCEEVVGILLAKDLLPYGFSSKEKQFNLKDVLRPAMFVPEGKRLDSLLKDFRAKHVHMAVVVDEYGSVSGLVTIEDVLEQIVGNIEDEHDIEEPETNIVQHAENQYIINAQTTLDDFNEYFSSDLEHPEFNTIGGVVMHAFGHLPKIGEVVKLGRFMFTVTDSDERRIKTLRLDV